MYKTLLISNIDYEKQKDEDVEIFFQIKDMEEVRDRIFDLFRDKLQNYAGKSLFTYQGFYLKMKVSEIPLVIEKLVKENIQIFSVYQPYRPI